MCFSSTPVRPWRRGGGAWLDSNRRQGTAPLAASSPTTRPSNIELSSTTCCSGPGSWRSSMSEPLKPKVVAFVPAKGSSERIENKNAKLLDGRPLLTHPLEKVLKCRTVDEVYLDTELDDIANLARHLPVKIMKRNRFLASNGTDGHALFMNEVRHVDADIYVQALCTAPFVRPETVDRAIDLLTRDARYDSVALVRKEKQYLWTDGRPDYGVGRIPNSVVLPPTIIEAMSLYVVRRDAALTSGRRFGNRVHLLETSPI